LRAPQNGWTPLYSASYKGHAKVVGALLAKGADMEAKADVRMTASRMDAPPRAAVHRHARESLAVATDDMATQFA
jgi:ankyrin repeat protein